MNQLQVGWLVHDKVINFFFFFPAVRKLHLHLFKFLTSPHKWQSSSSSSISYMGGNFQNKIPAIKISLHFIFVLFEKQTAQSGEKPPGQLRWVKSSSSVCCFDERLEVDVFLSFTLTLPLKLPGLNTKARLTSGLRPSGSYLWPDVCRRWTVTPAVFLGEESWTWTFSCAANDDFLHDTGSNTVLHSLIFRFILSLPPPAPNPVIQEEMKLA